MSGVDLEKLKGLQLDVSKFNFEPPQYTIAQSAIDDMNRRTQQITADLTRAREERDAEELRRQQVKKAQRLSLETMQLEFRYNRILQVHHKT